MEIKRSLSGVVESQVEANDFIFKLYSVGDTSVNDLLEQFEGLAGSLTFQLNLDTCPKCGKHLVNTKTFYACHDCAWFIFKEDLERLKDGN